MVDIDKVTNANVYEGDPFIVTSPFAINYELAINAGVRLENQIVPAGRYEIKKIDNLCLWFIEVDGFLSGEEKTQYRILLEER